MKKIQKAAMRRNGNTLTRRAKRVLAFEATKITHGEKAAEEARAASNAAFGGKVVKLNGTVNGKSGVVGDITVLPTTAIARARLESGISPAELFTEVGLTPSRREAKRLIEQGGLSVNEERIDSLERLLTVKDVGPEGMLLKAGKKKIHRVVIG
jgi:tyrosyl-tRNA synthetase